MLEKLTAGFFEPVFERVLLPNGQSLEVRGLPSSDILEVGIVNGAKIANLLRLLPALGLREEASEADYLSRFMIALHTCPDLVGEIIARASGIPDFVKECSALPFAVQVDALEATLRLTLAGREPEEIAATFSTILAMCNIATAPVRPGV